MEGKGKERKVSINTLLSIRQYMALNTLVERGIYESISEAVREGVERILKEHKDVLEEVKEE